VKGSTKLKLNAFHLKITGMFSVTLLTLAFSGLIKNDVLQIVLGILGSASITIFTFLIIEGYKHTHNVTKYMLRLLFIAVLAAYPSRVLFGGTKLSPQDFFSAPLTAFICLGAISLYDKLKTKGQKTFCVIFICLMSYIASFAWAPYAIILVFILFIYKDNFKMMAYYVTTFYTVIAVVSLFFLIGVNDFNNSSEWLMNVSQIGCVLALPLIKAYDGTKGLNIKWLAYLFYPAMLMFFMFLKLTFLK